MRINLKQARKKKGMTQQAVADYLHIGLRYYTDIERGIKTGGYHIWDGLEDLFKIHQRKLREQQDSHHDKADNPLKPLECQQS